MLFLSHSSADKSQVRRVAVDLLLEGWSVWFDELEMELGDALRARLIAGINASDYFALFLSKKSIRSKWIHYELARALEAETTLSRPFLLPIRLQPCEMPPALAERLVADFSNRQLYASQFEALRKSLEVKRLQRFAIPIEEVRVPLPLTRTLGLDRPRFEIWLKRLLLTGVSTDKLSPERVVISWPESYLRWRKYFTTSYERICKGRTQAELDTESLNKVHSEVADAYERIKAKERLLVEGVVTILSSPRPLTHFTSAELSVSVEIFVRTVVGALVDTFSGSAVYIHTALGSARLPALPDCRPMNSSALYDRDAAAALCKRLGVAGARGDGRRVRPQVHQPTAQPHSQPERRVQQLPRRRV